MKLNKKKATEKAITKKPVISRKQRTAAKAAVQSLLRDRYVRNFFGMPAAEELIDGNNYIIGPKGLYLIRKNKVGLFTTHLAQTKESIPLIEKQKQPVEGFKMTIKKKIPYEFMLKTVAFFKKVYKKKKGAEAVVQIFYNEETKNYFFHIDEQGVSGGSAEMDRDAKLETDNILVADIHSHNQMGAFFSGTDNRDEKEARIYGVMGKLNTPWPEMMFRAGDGQGGWLDIHMFQVFNTPEVGVVEVPDEWMAKVHTPSDYKEKSRYYAKKPGHHMRQDEIFASHYDKYIPPNLRGNRKSTGAFGRAGDVNQDEFEFPFGRWENDIDWEEPFEESDLQFLHAQGDTELAIESLIESAEILPPDESKLMWLGLIERLGDEAKDILRDAVAE